MENGIERRCGVEDVWRFSEGVMNVGKGVVGGVYGLMGIRGIVSGVIE